MEKGMFFTFSFVILFSICYNGFTFTNFVIFMPQVVIFVDNSGADIILGILPFARELLRHGAQVWFRIPSFFYKQRQLKNFILVGSFSSLGTVAKYDSISIKGLKVALHVIKWFCKIWYVHVQGGLVGLPVF